MFMDLLNRNVKGKIGYIQGVSTIKKKRELENHIHTL